MSSNATAGTQDDPIVKYFTDAPSPRASVSPNDIQEALARLEKAAVVATAPDAAEKRWVPGLSFVVVGRQGNACEMLRCEGHGLVRLDDPKSGAPGPETLFPCASLSKPVSATLLADAGLPLDPGGWHGVVKGPNGQPYHFPKSPAPNLRQWLGHRTGMHDHAGDLVEDMNPAMTRDEIVERVMTAQIGVNPGAYNYTNFGFTIGCVGVAAAVDPISSSWEEFAAKHLAALGMHRSTYEFQSVYDPRQKNAKRVFPHRARPEPPELERVQPVGWTWHVVAAADERNPTRQAPAGALLSSAYDLGSFLSRHLSNPYLNFPPRIPPAAEKLKPSHWYALGWNVANYSDTPPFENALKEFGRQPVNEIAFSHSGAFSLGAGTCLRFDPVSGFGVAVLTNGEPTGVAETLVQLFFNTLYGRPTPAGCDDATLLAYGRAGMMGVLWERKIANYKRYHEKTRPVSPNLPPGEVFRGHSAYYGSDIVIEHVDAQLILRMGKGLDGQFLWSFPLQSIEGDASTFVYETTGENEVGLSAIHVEWKDGVIVRVVDDWLNDGGPDREGTGMGVIHRSA
jgi:CubicO group peptidase (beta-lactamase class C family)